MPYSGRQSSPLTTICHAPSAVRLNGLHRSANRRSSLACARTASARSCGVLFSQIRLMSLLPTGNGPGLRPCGSQLVTFEIVELDPPTAPLDQGKHVPERPAFQITHRTVSPNNDAGAN